MSTGVNGLIITSDFDNHPFKKWVDQVLDNHFMPSIADRFYFVMEALKYSKKDAGVQRQIKDQRFMLEVYYEAESGFSVYICDLFSGWSKKRVEHHLLKYITDKVVDGSIGKDWKETDFKGVSSEIKSEKHKTEYI